MTRMLKAACTVVSALTALMPAAMGYAATDPDAGESAPVVYVDGKPIYTSTTRNQTVGMPPAAIDLSAIPLGNGKYSRTTPQVGYEYICDQQYTPDPGYQIPPWVNATNNTWDMRTKLAVEYRIPWQNNFTATVGSTDTVLTGDGLPQLSGVFPPLPSDPAVTWNPDDTSIARLPVNLTVPTNPVVNSTPFCEGGKVGVAIDGVTLLDGLNENGLDAPAGETQDVCHGHPNEGVQYHYHSLSPCLLTHHTTKPPKDPENTWDHQGHEHPGDSREFTTEQIGWALDGFGIFAEYDDQGRLLTNADLDECHGRTSPVPWHGSVQNIYHYSATFEFPYLVGCFRGTPQ